MNIKNYLILVLCVIFSTQLVALNLKLKNVAKVNGGIVKLHDLVESFEGDSASYQKIKNTVIENLPFDKRMLNVKSVDVTEIIRKNHPNLQFKVSSNVVAVRWEELHLSNEIIQKEASIFVKKYYSLGEDAKVTILNIPKIYIPTENIKLIFEKSKFSDNSSMVRLDGKVISQNNVINVFNVLAKIEQQQFAYQANKSIKKGERIDDNDFIKIIVNVNMNHNYAQNLSELIEISDLVASRFIPKGSILRTTDVLTAPDVNRNDIVVVMVKSSSMQISYTALARADGWIGDKILMQNLESKQTFQAEVIDKNKVLVEIEKLSGTSLSLAE